MEAEKKGKLQRKAGPKDFRLNLKDSLAGTADTGKTDRCCCSYYCDYRCTYFSS